MRSLVLELQHDCTIEQVSISTLVRKLVLICNKLGLDSTWAMLELHGYTNADMPKYRKIEGKYVAKVPSRGYVPVEFPRDIFPDADKFYLQQSVEELEASLSSPDRFAYICLAPEFQESMAEYFNRNFEFRFQVPIIQIKRVLNVVRSEVLNLTIKMEHEGILGEQMEFTTEEKNKAKSNITVNIHGDMQGVVGDVISSSLNQNLTINKTNDFEQLTKFLNEHGVNKVDIDNLITAINTDEPPKDVDTYGENVTGWYAKMIQKAADGSWQIGISTAAGVLTEALKLFYWG